MKIGTSLTNDGSSKRNIKLLNAAVIVASLGYFVDIYDLLLFSIVRIPSLKSLGLSGVALTQNGMFLLNIQMVGMLEQPIPIR